MAKVKFVPASEENVLEHPVIFIGAPPIWRNSNQDAGDSSEQDASDEPEDPNEERVDDLDAGQASSLGTCIQRHQSVG